MRLKSPKTSWFKYSISNSSVQPLLFRAHENDEDPALRTDLTVKPDEVRVIRFKFFPVNSDVSRKIDISSMCLQLGNSSKQHALLTWRGNQSPAETQIASEQTVVFQNKFEYTVRSKLSSSSSKHSLLQFSSSFFRFSLDEDCHVPKAHTTCVHLLDFSALHVNHSCPQG